MSTGAWITISSWITSTGTAPGQSARRSQSRARAAFSPSAAVPWTGLFSASVTFGK